MKIELDPSHPLLDHHRIDRAGGTPGCWWNRYNEAGCGNSGSDGIRACGSACAFFEAAENIKLINSWRKSIFIEFQTLQLSSRPKYPADYWIRGKPFGESRIHHELSLGTAESEVSLPEQRWNQTVFVPETDIYSVFFHGTAFRFLTMSR